MVSSLLGLCGKSKVSGYEQGVWVIRFSHTTVVRCVLRLVTCLSFICSNLWAEPIQWPLPAYQQNIESALIEAPVIKLLAEDSNPVAVGWIASGGPSFKLQVSLPEFEQPVDIYLGIASGADWWLSQTDSKLYPLAQNLSVWKKSNTESFIRQLIGPINLQEINAGNYLVHLYVVPEDETDFQKYFHWSVPVELDGNVESTGVISGYVQDAEGPVSGAVVRVHTDTPFATTDGNGYFQLKQLASTSTAKLTAWAPGYYNQFVDVDGWADSDLQIQLEPYTAEDNEEYEWVSAELTEGQERNCISCHSDSEHPEKHLTYDDWKKSAHARSATNPRFLSMYQGSDLTGNTSPATRYENHQDYGRFPLPPDETQPYYGPGYKLDFPATEGNCASCHAPYAAVNNPHGVNPLQLDGIATEGVGCDYCHKIKGVSLGHDGMPLDGNPGVLSYQLARPEPERQLFLGSFDDMAPGNDSFSPIYKQGQICAGCHYAKFWDVVVYNSFGEWLESNYSNPRTGKSCQQCHMPAGLTDRVIRLDEGGELRNPEGINSHQFIGGEDETLLKSAAEVTAEAIFDNDNISVDVVIKNQNAGHHLPTGSPLRHLILIVEVFDDADNLLTQISGNETPAWVGEYANKAGTVYAKVLEELWTGVYPSAAYWNQTTVRSDNRIAANGQDQQNFQFTASAQGAITVRVKLIYRRAYEELRKNKQWSKQDTVLFEKKLNLRGSE